MYLNVFRTLPRELGIAFSGGVDSAVMLYVALERGCDVKLITVDHGGEQSEREVEFTKQMAIKYGIDHQIYDRTESAPKGYSKEAWWSEHRKRVFHSAGMYVATGHHLNDAVEWYLMTALDGTGGYIMDYSNLNIIRPLLLVPKESIEAYAHKWSIPHLTDPTNADVTFNRRNRIRHELLPKVLELQPGLVNTIRNRIVVKEQQYSEAMKSWHEITGE